MAAEGWQKLLRLHTSGPGTMHMRTVSAHTPEE